MFKGFIIGCTVVCLLNTIVGLCAAVEYQSWPWYFASTLNLLGVFVFANIKTEEG